MKFIRETKRGYKFDKRIFWASFILIIGIVGFAMYLNHFDFGTNYYIECKSDICKNPMYNLPECKTKLTILWFIPIYETLDCRQNCDIFNQETIPRGIYGKKTPLLLSYIAPISIIILLLSFLINHLVHNKGRRFDIEIPITKKFVINRDMFKEADNEVDKNNRKN